MKKIRELTSTTADRRMRAGSSPLRTMLSRYLFFGALVPSILLASCLSSRPPEPTALGNLGTAINSRDNDYGPVLRDSITLIFTSNRIDPAHTGLKETFDRNRPAALYFAMRLTSEWDEAAPFDLLSPNQKEGEKGTITFAPQPNNMNAIAYVTNCDRKENVGGCDILILEGGEKGRFITLGEPLNTTGWDGHPSLTKNGKRLYFASDREGGFGGLDIWYVDMQGSGLWGKPVHMGPEVNTEQDELSPFYDQQSRTLYFAAASSDGNMDIYRLEDESNQRKALPAPYNTTATEITPFVLNGRLFLASDRTGGCGGLDLYSFTLRDLRGE